ncbi:MAG: NUDIX hydrolase, partial [Candidatus Subteraquimicrobiales bacterium]|nr:NUDIX hydrolase [Candidatus Subteraquimicrobiales bacterium]
KTCAIRELEEETGYLCQDIVRLTSLYTTPGYSGELLHLYFASNLRSGKTKREEGEEIYLEVMEISLDEVLRLIKEEKIKDGKTICGVCLALILGYLRLASSS